MILRTVGQILKVEAVLMMIPLAIAVIKNENTILSFCITVVLLAVLATVFTVVPVRKTDMYAGEGLVIVAFSWILMSAIGALPFSLSGAMPSYLDSLFETVSGFTTTGATILENMEILPMSINFWRCFTHWIGGMGVLVFVLAILPGNNMRSMHILRAEVPGPSIGKLVAKTRITARILYAIYITFTVLQAVLLKIGGNTLFDSVTMALSTAGTGGFSGYTASIGAYNSLYTEVICIIFMLIFSLNFNLFYLLLLRQVKRVVRSEELWVFFGIVTVSILAIAFNIRNVYGSLSECFRNSVFWVSSIISTTGFGTADINSWPVFSQTVLLLLMFCGGCAGSTAGGLKLSRVIILVKTGIRGLKKTLNPNKVETVKIDGESVGVDVTHGVSTYFVVYCLITMLSVLIISLDKYGFNVSFTSVVSCINNVGPIIGGPPSFMNFSPLSKVVFILDMLIGRLEIYPILILFMRSTWKKAI